MSAEPSEYTRTVRRPDPRRRESWCREGATHDHGACGNLWDSASRRDTTEAVRWIDEQGNPPAPWRFDVPDIPASVTAVEDRVGWIWVREGAAWVLWRGSPGTGAYRLYGGDLMQRAPLVECEDPRAAS